MKDGPGYSLYVTFPNSAGRDGMAMFWIARRSTLAHAVADVMAPDELLRSARNPAHPEELMGKPGQWVFAREVGGAERVVACARIASVGPVVVEPGDERLLSTLVLSERVRESLADWPLLRLELAIKRHPQCWWRYAPACVVYPLARTLRVLRARPVLAWLWEELSALPEPTNQQAQQLLARAVQTEPTPGNLAWLELYTEAQRLFDSVVPLVEREVAMQGFAGFATRLDLAIAMSVQGYAEMWAGVPEEEEALLPMWWDSAILDLVLQVRAVLSDGFSGSDLQYVNDQIEAIQMDRLRQRLTLPEVLWSVVRASYAASNQGCAGTTSS